jgi:hypothetical protein
MANEMSAHELTQCAALINASISNVFKGLEALGAQVSSIWEQQRCKAKQPDQGDLKPLLAVVRQILDSESLRRGLCAGRVEGLRDAPAMVVSHPERSDTAAEAESQ